MPKKKKDDQQEYPFVFGEFTKFRHYKKNAIILRKGKVENYISVVCKGTAGMFLENDDAEICYAFVFENGYFSSYESFVTRKPSQVSLKSLEVLTIASISYGDMQIVLGNVEGLQYGKQIVDQLFFGAQQRIFSLITQSAEERYRELILSRPEVFKNIKQKYIASYLGITPVSLSRIRAQVTAKK